MATSATLLLTHRPTDIRCAEIAYSVARNFELGDGRVTWTISDDIPPGYGVDIADQLAAYKRDTPGEPVYLTVTLVQ